MTLPAWFYEEKAATLGRIRAQVEKNLAEDREKTAALKWCRANGNPHKQEGK